jgi:alkylation response protein AidB-like acyl-CoA dehydrogenase
MLSTLVDTTANTPVDTPRHTPRDTSFTERAAALGPLLAARADEIDRTGAWAGESFVAVRDAGLLTIAVPAELGGDGATIRDVAMVQRELARHCGSTALASAMHQHVTAFTAWRYRRLLPGAEATLRRIADDGIVIASTGGGDFTSPTGSAVAVDGGYVVSGTKSFVSQAPVATVVSTMFPVDGGVQGRRVINVAVPFASEGVSVIEHWDTMGMRSTASHDVVFRDVFVPTERVLADRPHGTIDPPLQVISSIAFPIISSVYLGIAEGAFAHAVDGIGPRVAMTSVQRRFGEMRHDLQVAEWALDGALDAVGDDPTPAMSTVVTVMTAKREIVLAAERVTSMAMEVTGGSTFRNGSPIGRAHRDVMAGRFHPLDPETSLVHGGRHALGLSTDIPADWRVS